MTLTDSIRHGLADDLSAYVRATIPDRGFVEACVAQAWELVDRRVGTVEVPDVIRRLAVREVAADLFHRRATRNGLATFDGADLQPVRVTRDPMNAASDILNPYLPVVIA